MVATVSLPLLTGFHRHHVLLVLTSLGMEHLLDFPPLQLPRAHSCSCSVADRERTKVLHSEEEAWVITTMHKVCVHTECSGTAVSSREVTLVALVSAANRLSSRLHWAEQTHRHVQHQRLDEIAPATAAAPTAPGGPSCAQRQGPGHSCCP